MPSIRRVDRAGSAPQPAAAGPSSKHFLDSSSDPSALKRRRCLPDSASRGHAVSDGEISHIRMRRRCGRPRQTGTGDNHGGASWFGHCWLSSGSRYGCARSRSFFWCSGTAPCASGTVTSRSVCSGRARPGGPEAMRLCLGRLCLAGKSRRMERVHRAHRWCEHAGGHPGGTAQVASPGRSPRCGGAEYRPGTDPAGRGRSGASK